MILPNVDIVMSPFLPTLHMPIIVIGYITFSSAGSESTQVKVMNTVLFAK